MASRPWELEEAFLDARYWCVALRAEAKKRGLAELSRGLGEGLSEICVEMRRVLGTTAVSRPFPKWLLEAGFEELLRGCREAAERLRSMTGSRAAEILLEALEGYDGGGASRV